MSEPTDPRGPHEFPGAHDAEAYDGDYDEGYVEHYDDTDARPADPEDDDRRRKLIAPLVLVATVALLLLGVFGALATLRGAPEEDKAAVAAPSGPATSSGTVAAGPVAPTTTVSTSTTTSEATNEPTSPVTPTESDTVDTASPPTPSATAMPTPTTTTPMIREQTPTAGSELTRIAAADAARLPGNDRISAYLQTRTPGQVDTFMTGPVSGSHTWTSADILAYHQQLKSKFPSVVLFKGNSGKWVSAVSVPGWQSTADAKIWCQRTYSQFGEYIPGNYALRDRCDVP